MLSIRVSSAHPPPLHRKASLWPRSTQVYVHASIKEDSIPSPPSTVEQLCRARFFSKLELRGANNLILIRERHYEDLVMPYGLVNAVFQAFVNEGSTTSKVLGRLLENCLYVKVEKCQFHQVAVYCLGRQISPQGVIMDERKVEAVRSTSASLKTSVPLPLTSLLKGGPRELMWSPAADEALRLLKGHLTFVPLLKQPDSTLSFVV